MVIALITELRKQRTTAQIDAFATPTIVHFCAVLLVSSIMSAPWHQLSSAAITVGVFGVAGIVYTAVVMRRVSRQSGYTLVFEDWLFHTALPFVAALATVAHADVSGTWLGQLTSRRAVPAVSATLSLKSAAQRSTSSASDRTVG